MHRLLSVLVGVAVLAGTSAEAARSDPTDIGREDGLVTTLVVGGSAVPISDVPWQAALLNANRFDRQDDAYFDRFCGAAIISDEWLVTAAHWVMFLAVISDLFRISPSRSFAQGWHLAVKTHAPVIAAGHSSRFSTTK